MQDEGYVRLPRAAYEAALAGARRFLEADPWAAHDERWARLAAYLADPGWARPSAEFWPTDQYFLVAESVVAALEPWMPRR